MTDLRKPSRNELLLCPSQLCGGLTDSIALKIEADGKVVICCQMCQTGNSVAKIPVWLANIDCVPNSVPSDGGLSPRGPTEELLTLRSSSGGSEAVEVTM